MHSVGITMVVAINSERPSNIASSFCNHSDSVQMIWCFKKGLADITAILSQKGQLSKKKNQRKSAIYFYQSV